MPYLNKVILIGHAGKDGELRFTPGDLNKVILIGHAGKDGELRFTPGGTPVCKFSLAVSEKVKDEKHTEWFEIVCFKKTAEWAGNYVKKGIAVYVEGRIRTEKWDDKDSGKPREKKVIIADSVKVFKKAQESNYRPDQDPNNGAEINEM